MDRKEYDRQKEELENRIMVREMVRTMWFFVASLIAIAVVYYRVK
ncbi:hypothetical protein [Gorillibacterium sp. sgz5001074]